MVGVSSIKNGNKQYTDCFVSKGYSPEPGVDYNETFSCPQCDSLDIEMGRYDYIWISSFLIDRAAYGSFLILIF